MVMRRAEVTIDSIAAGGDGVARVEGLVVFVPRAAPGDRALVEFTTGARFARARLIGLPVPSSLRVQPPCAHYVRDQCGGCQLQHLGYDSQRSAKSRIIADSLARIGKRAVLAPDVRPSGRPFRYRRKLTLALRRRASRWIAGLHPYDAPGEVFALDDCPITEERVMAAWREVLSAAETFPDVRELRGAVRLDDVGASFVLEGGERWPRSEELFRRCPSLAALWWIAEDGSRRLLHHRGDEQPPGASFTQVNASVAAELRQYVLDRVMRHEPATVVDGYAGLGDTAMPLAERGVRVTAIELDRAATAWCAARLASGSRAIAGRVEDELAASLPADVVLLNPPRAGVDARVAETLERAEPRPRAVLYVSCDPATLSRDVRRMPGYEIVSLVAFDMFPQTAHVETVCELAPREAEARPEPA
ncbi:MAG TPA: TRAM domain-containing protein [Gemmatimonadaceae bacterium]|jgi:23S rRNA (uracil1939-C5)-methyltransferase|nr:TRAM domain-containing protein [Gemmatimonadaceae bacterium]